MQAEKGLLVASKISFLMPLIFVKLSFKTALKVKAMDVKNIFAFFQTIEEFLCYGDESKNNPDKKDFVYKPSILEILWFSVFQCDIVKRVFLEERHVSGKKSTSKFPM